MAKRCCCCSFFSCFSGNNISAQPPDNNNASPAVATEEEAPDLRWQDPETLLPASSATEEAPDVSRQDPESPIPAFTSHDASSSAESASSSASTQNEPRPHEAPASVDPSSGTSTVSELTKKIKDVSAIDGENDNINLDGLIEDISELLRIIKTKSSDKKPSTAHYWPSSSIFPKLKEILSEAADGASAVKDLVSSQHSSDAMKVVQKLLIGLGQAHWAAAGLLVVAGILERIETVSANRDECLSLLEEMGNLAQHVKDIKERPGSKKGMEASIKKGTDMIVEGAFMCCTQMNTSGTSRFLSTSVNKDELAKFQQKLQKMYRRMDNRMFICILDAIECANVRPPVKERERSYPEYAVGIEEQLQEVIDLLEWESPKNALAVMVHGLGGMGKTTLADAVFARLYIEGCKYSMVRLFDDINSTPNIVELQRCILKDLMLGSSEEDQKPVLDSIHRFEDGQREIGRILEKEVAFIYIDNALEQDPLENLLPRNMEKVKRCRLLISARSAEVRKGCSIDAVKFYPMKYLPSTEAMILLKKELNYGMTDDTELLNSDQLDQIVNLCGGIPKLLSVLARFIRFDQGGQQKAFRVLMEEKENWNVQIDINAYFFIYDRLPERVKDPFLDICSFFNGCDWNAVTNTVGESNIDVLEKRGLVNKDKNMNVIVHDVILTIAHQITKETRFRFQTTSEFEELLKKDLQGIKGIWLNGIYHTFHISARKLDSMSDSLRILALGNNAKVEGTCEKIFEKLVYFQGKVPCLPFNVSQSKELRFLEWQPRDLNFLKEMPSNLKHMELDGRLLSEDAFEISSSDLQQLQDLRTLRLLNFAGLKILPEEWGDLLKCLQELDLSGCQFIKVLPRSISKLQSLRKLRLYFCSSLKRLLEDFGSLNSLQEFNFSYCKSIEELPGSISKLQSLRELDMSGCSSLKRLPEDFGSLSFLQELNLSFCESIEELPGSFSKLHSLRKLKLYGCSSLKRLPEDFGSLSSLQVLDILPCESMEELPESISKLQSLRELNLYWCSSLKRLPEDFGSLSSLQEFRLSDCKSIEELPGSISKLQSLKNLRLDTCSCLKRLPEDFGSLSSLQELNLSYCYSIHELPGSISKLQYLRQLKLYGCSSLKRLPEDFGSLSSLQELGLSSCESIEELPGSISKLQSLRKLYMFDCTSLKRLPKDFGSLSSLQKLNLSFCKSIEELPGSISKLQSLRELDMHGCSSLKSLPEDFGSLSSLQELTLSFCTSTEELPGSISKLQPLRGLRLYFCSSLKRFPEDFGSLSSLQELCICSCDSIEELPRSISKLYSLRKLDMSSCSSLKKLPEDFGFLSSLQELNLSFCTAIEELPGSISKLQSLKYLRLNSCSSLKRLPEDFISLTPLEVLQFEECPGLDPLSMQMLLEMSSKDVTWHNVKVN